MFRYKPRNLYLILHVFAVTGVTSGVTTTKSIAVHNYQLESSFT